MNDYSLFGLHLRSELALPELLPAQPTGTPDVVVELGEIAEPREGPGLHVLAEALILEVPDVARYRVEAGRSIRIEPVEHAPAQNIRLYLLGSTMGLLLHQRGLLPLHANSVEIDGKAVAFMGESGAGKSTLAAWFQDRGHRVLTDDVSVVRFDPEGRALVAPGVARLRLWRDAVEATGRSAEDYEPSFLGDLMRDKFDVPLAGNRAGDAAVPLGAVYLLDREGEAGIARLDGVDAVEAIFANTYRGQFVGRVGSSALHMAASVSLARSIPIFRAARCWGLESLDAESEKLLRHVQAILSP